MSQNNTIQSVISTHKEKYDYLTKLILVGGSGTGKTSILQQFLSSSFTKRSQTIGVQFYSKIIQINDTVLKLQIWDTAGQERFRSMTRSYYRGSAGVLLVFDISNKNSLYELKDYIQDIQELTNNASIVIVGNKLDIYENIDPTQRVTDEDVEEVMDRIENAEYMRVSALTGENIFKAFYILSSSILTKVELGLIDPEVDSYGIQYGDLPYENQLNTIDTQQISDGYVNTRFGLTNVIKRKTTTLSLVERSGRKTTTIQPRCSC
ncbi:hypothetical protein WICMUC_005732 [Wickerhamomyces mucosus]|uniref:GTP-binding protein n=1 Tax=Wickerhamomyces mucosus TaxID=1378264 RepID=A0A9P8P3U1_9ASCO|nr:hypothetical protein WICMUC_005732 [Wickerhamomyces mucosus]